MMRTVYTGEQMNPEYELKMQSLAISPLKTIIENA